jgi:hypothetical protein
MTQVQQFDFSVDLLRAILWQYEDAAGLQSLLASKAQWYSENQTEFWESWRRDVFDLTTANDFGCAVWGVILGVPLSLGQPGTGAREVFGFGEFNTNFENGNFGRDRAGVAGLTTEQKRLVLRLRYFQLVSDGSVPHTNFVLQSVFGQGYVLDGGDMTATYVFETALPSQVIAVLEQFDLLPRPAGVGINILINPDNVFGFDPIYLNFENGQFGAQRNG